MPPPPPLPDVNHTYPLPLPSTGTGLFASQDIAPGDLIICIARPLLAVPDSPHFTDTCSNCLVCVTENEEEEEVKLRKCGGCGVVRFCGEVGRCFFLFSGTGDGEEEEGRLSYCILF